MTAPPSAYGNLMTRGLVEISKIVIILFQLISVLFIFDIMITWTKPDDDSSRLK